MKRKKIVLIVLVLILTLASIELMGVRFCHKYEHISRMREYLMGSDNSDDKPLVTSHPYMGSIPTPLYSYKGINQHNIDGYRGARLPYFKDSSSYRILFLGGSTTYSIGAIDADSTWPEEIKSKIEQLVIQTGHTKQKHIEVLNGGMPMATSAELLTHYLFKYRYYKPDLVVIHSGINDALAYQWGKGKYNPDYSFWRNGFDYLKPMSSKYRWLLHSKFLSMVIITQRYHDYIELMPSLHKGEKTPCDWYPDSLYMSVPEQNAFYNNTKSLIREAISDGSDVLLVPVIYNKESDRLGPGQEAGIIWHDKLLKLLSEEFNIPYCNIDESMEKYQEYWLDAVHLKPKGIELKSIKVAKYIANIIVANPDSSRTTYTTWKDN